MNLTRLLLIIAGVALLIGMLRSLLLDSLFYLCFGWVPFLARVLGQIDVNLAGVMTALVSLALLAAGLHAFASWLNRHMSKTNPSRSWHFRSTAAILGVIVLMFVAGISAIGITHQTTWLLNSPDPFLNGGIRQASGKATSQNNLKQATFASIKFQDDNNPHTSLGVLMDPEGRLLHGWQTRILPYLEQERLFKQIDLLKPWDHPDNAAAMRQEVKIFLHPQVDEKTHEDRGLSHYAGNVHALGFRMPLYPQGFPDGTSQTILIGEVTTNLKPWGHPAGWRDPGLGLATSPNGFGGPVRGVTQFSLADGSVRAIRNDVSLRSLRAASTPAGNEVLGDDW